jgi:hypothetical protein
MEGERWARLWAAIAKRVSGEITDGWAHAACEAAVALLGVDGAVLTLHSTTRTQELLGASDDWAAKVSQLQYTVGDGPGVEASTRGAPVLVTDLSQEQIRWPGFAQAALSEGVGAVFSFPLLVGAVRFGLMELYRRRGGQLAGPALADALVLSSLALDAALGDAAAAERAGRKWPQAGGSSYQDVHVATGMLAAQLHVSLEDAFSRLRGHAYALERPILDVAHDVLQRRIPLEELAD